MPKNRNEYHRKYYQTHKEAIKKSSKKWAQKNPDKLKEYAQKQRASGYYQTEKYKQYRKEYFATHPKNPESSRRDVSKHHLTARRKFLEMYGNKCNCCGESNYEFLTIEHRLGQRGQPRKDTSREAYKKAIENYNPEVYEILCMNCNHAKGRYGYCPHNNKL